MQFLEQHIDLCVVLTKSMVKPYDNYVFASTNNHIILLKRCPFTVTNKHYIKDIRRRENVLFRGTNFYVVAIFNKWRPKECVTSCIYYTFNCNKIYLIVGQLAHDNFYKYDYEHMCEMFSDGIVFCSSLGCAFYNSEIPLTYDGEWISYHNNGEVMSLECHIDGKKNGYFTYYFDNGQKMSEGRYQNDKKIGRWCYWNEKGERIEHSKQNNFDIS